MDIVPTQRFVVPEVVVSHFHVREGDMLADYGAGTGYFLPALAAAVGPTGRVYAVEIQKNLVESLGALVRTKHLDQVQVLWGDLEEKNATKIPTNAVDIGILVNTLFQIEDTDGAIAEITRTLRPGGRLVVIDWSESFGGLGPQPSAIVSETAARALFESAGYTLETTFPAGGHHYGIIFRRP